MTLFILAETSAGYALLKAKDKKLLKRDDINEQTNTVEGICSLLKVKKFAKFTSASGALEEMAGLTEGKVTPMLTELLNEIKDEKQATLAVMDPKLGNAINKLPQFSITPISDSSTSDLFRGVRSHLPSLIPGLLPEDMAQMHLGLSHSLSRHKLKFSTDKIDVMIIQAIALLDDLDKELNTYAMRVKEWYGWHFPEMAKIINDNVAFARVIQKMGFRTNAAQADLAEVLPEEIEIAVKAAAEISMGSEITQDDLENISELADQVVELSEYRRELAEYLAARMQAIAPNLTTLVGELVGARLIAHAGSLMNLAKNPASTIQILGAEKALFRALKTKHDTPKYGLIYHASLVGQATGKNKGKIARMLATKTALGLRIDSMSDWGANGEHANAEPTELEKAEFSMNSKVYLERKLRNLEGKPLGPRSGIGMTSNGQAQPPKWELKEARKYNPDADGISSDKPAAAGQIEARTQAPKNGLIQEVNGPVASDSDSNEDQVMTNGIEEVQVNGKTDKETKETKEERAVRKAAKAARKAEKAAKKEAKRAKHAEKELEKKRKHDEEDETAEVPDKKKKKREKHAR